MMHIKTYRRQAVKLGIVCLFVLFQGQYVFSATSTTPQTLDEINKEVSPGSIVLLESGTYTTPIAPASSGTKDKPIIYKPAKGASPLFKNVSPAILMKDKSFVKIEGVKFLDCSQFMSIESSSIFFIFSKQSPCINFILFLSFYFFCFETANIYLIVSQTLFCKSFGNLSKSKG